MEGGADLVDGQQVQVLDDEVEDEPVAQLLQVGQRHRLQDGLHVRPADRFSALREKKQTC